MQYHIHTEGWRWALISVTTIAVLVTVAIILKEVLL